MARYLIRRMILGSVLVAGFASTIGMADTRTLSPEEARQVAWRALQANKPHITLQVADALAKRSPDDFEAAFLRAMALKNMNRNPEAVKAGKAAFKKAEADGHKFDAAHLIAKSHFANGSQGLAQFWLRRAEHNAPNEKARKAAVKDFQFVRRVKPVRTQLDFAIFPTSNINNGSTNDEIVIAGLPFRVPSSGQPHSGTGIRFGFHTTYRKPVSDTTLLRFGVKGTTTQYVLSSKAKALGSGLKGSDFAYAALEVQAGVTLFRPDFKGVGFGSTRLDAALGRSWYGGNSLSNFGRISVGQDYGFSKNTMARARFAVERQNRLDNATSSATIKSFDLDMVHSLKNKARLSYGITLRDTASDSNLVETDVKGARVSYTAKPMKMGITPTFSMSYDKTDYTRLAVGGVGRVDERLSGTVSVLFPSVSYYGFSPTVSVTASRKDSTIDIYSTKNLNMNVGFQSSF